MEIFDQIDRQVAADQGAVGRFQADVGRRLNQAQQDVTETGEAAQQLLSGQQGAGVAIEEGQEAATRIRAVEGARASTRQEKGSLLEQLEELETAASSVKDDYARYLDDIEAARAEHARLSKRLDPAQHHLGGRSIPERAEMKPVGTKVKAAAAGEIPAYEAQPLDSTLRAIDRLIADNPLGDDELMNRIEAALHAHRAQLSELTETTDIPAREVEKIIAAARKGKLAPVMVATLKSEYRRVWEQGDIVINRELANVFRNLEVVIKEPGQFSRVLAAYTNFFKTYATLSPGFHIRNALSAIFVNFSDGVKATNQLDGIRLWRQYAKSDDPLKWLKGQPEEIQSAFQSVFGSGAGGRYFEAGFADPGRLGSSKVVEQVFSNPVTRFSQRVGQDFTEGPVRLGMALDSIRKGADVRDAMARITRFHFDYGQVSAFDEKAKRLIPFWTFMSRNLPMSLTQMWRKPRLFNQYQSFVRNFSGDPIEGTPDYFENVGAFPLGDAELAGMPLFLQPDFAHTRLDEDFQNIEDLLSLENPGRALTSFNPIYTAPLEFATGQDFYTGRTYDETDFRPVGGLQQGLEPLARLLGQTKTTPDGTVVVNEKFIDAMRSLVPPLDRASRVVPSIGTGNRSQDQEDRQIESIARFLGIPIRQLSPAQQSSTERGARYERLDEQRLQRALLEAQQ
jgi:hypothetical protein